MSVDPELLAAQNEVEARRAAFLHSVDRAKVRLAPSMVASDAWEGAKQKSSDLAHGAVEQAKKRPALVGGIVAAVGLFLARRPISRIVSDSFDRLTRDDEDTENVPSMPKAPPRRTRSSEGKAPSVEQFHDVTKPIEDKNKPPAAKRKPAKNKKTEKAE